jgi:hypothetical protein
MAPPPSDESSVNSGGQVDDELEIQLPPFSVGETQSPTRVNSCLVCLRHCDEDLCSSCTTQVKRNLLDISETVERRNGNLVGYCLECHEGIKKGHHHVHEGMTIPLDFYDGKMVAWVTGKEKWSSVFHGIQVMYTLSLAMFTFYFLLLTVMSISE